ncbi:SGS-domain-containing protein [Wallemia mellicola]|uniref:SGS-domain-containing protein n=1 Tax=Wallemia mellicola TaxID=1708541 RepID=A0A4T0RT32_9BASI|nr:SGS-domain-containing protein [Wallemia mellicola]TIC30208.1 SGS-domain-containing protein [Wallemia mellicola]TIC41692.1 SGS-domain-containing protein [Wallemia mellicola]
MLIDYILIYVIINSWFIQTTSVVDKTVYINSLTGWTIAILLIECGSDFRYDFYQTPSIIEISLFVKNVREEDVDISFGEKELNVQFKDGRQFSLNPLSFDIKPTECKYTLKSMKVELILVKSQEGINWNSLVGDSSCESMFSMNKENAETCRQRSTSVNIYSINKGKDWNKVALDDEEETNDGNPDDFFKKLFANADDDVRKAMMKSYSESGGTSLSTNWEEVKKAKVETKPPSGTEAKKL